jgi:Nif-specific regulatory protein
MNTDSLDIFVLKYWLTYSKDKTMMTYETNIPNREECQTCSLTFAYKEVNLLYDIAVMLTSTTEMMENVEKAMRRLKQHGYLERCALFRKKEDAMNWNS